MTDEEKVQLLVDVAVIKTIVTNMGDAHKELKPDVKKNTRFRLMISGFILISAPLVAFIIKVK